MATKLSIQAGTDAVLSTEESADRLQAIMKREIAFIPNANFSARRGFRECENELVRDIEQGLLDSPAVKTPAGLPAHYARMVSVPLLSPEEESAIFERMNYCKFRAESIRKKLSPKRCSEELLAEYDEMLERGERLRNYLLQANTRLVMSIAKKFADARNSFDDLLSHGITSLMHAAEKFDFDRGNRFSTYATCAVQRDLYRAVMNLSVRQKRFTSGTTEILDECVEAPEDQQSPAAQLASYDKLRSAMGELMECLDERERIIVLGRFGFEGESKKQSYSKLGSRLGVSKERARQIGNRALDKLRSRVPEFRLERFLD